MAKRLKITFNAKITPVKPVNDEFTLCKCYVMAINKNRNLSFISKETADEALATLYNIPVIGHLYEDEDGNLHMGGHDYVLAKDKEGNVFFKPVGVPYGVVPQQDNVHYEDVTEPDGSVRTYLVCDIILWTGRFPELCSAIYSEDLYFGQSMEINVDKYEPLKEDTNYTNILSYSYSALCLLGKSDDPEKHVEPCFPMASVEPYEFSLDDDKFSELMTRMKEELAVCFEKQKAEEGGKEMEQDSTVVQTEEANVESGAVAENATTAQENGAVDEANEGAQFTAVAEPQSQESTHENADNASEQKSFGALASEKYNIISQAVHGLESVVRGSDGCIVQETYCYLIDFDDQFVYIDETTYTYTSDGCTRTRRNLRCGYSFNEESMTATVDVSGAEEVFLRWATKQEIDQLENMRTQYEALVAEAAQRAEDERKHSYDVAIEEFADLEGNEEFARIAEQKYSYESVDALKNACYIVRGKFSLSATQRKPAAEPVIPIARTNNFSESTGYDLYERFHAEYGNK